MKKKNQNEAENQSPDRLDRILNSNLIANYVNLSIQGLIALAFAMIIGLLLRFIWKDIPIWLILPITFVLMIMFSVIFSKKLSRIQTGFKVQTWYFGLLKKYAGIK